MSQLARRTSGGGLSTAAAGALAPFLARSLYKAWRRYKQVGGKTRTTVRRPLRTRRRTRRRRLIQKASSMGTGGYISKFYYGKRRLRPRALAILYKNTSKQYYGFDGSEIVDTTGPGQAWFTGLSMFERQDIQAMANRLISGNTEYTSRACYESCHAELQLSNLTNTNLRITIYDVIARRDADIPDPIDTLSPGSVDEGGDMSDKSKYVFSPYQIDLFTQHFKVLKQTYVMMAEGQSHIHRVGFAPNKILNRAVIESSDNPQMRGLTTWSIVSVQGTPCANVTDTVSLTSPHLGVVWKKWYRFGFVTNNYTRTSISTNLETIDPYFIDIASGNVETEVEA